MANISFNVSSIIENRLYEQRMTRSQLAKKLGVTLPAVSTMLSYHVYKTDRLIQLSQLFNFNFFRFIADKIPIDDPPKQDPVDQSAQIKITEQTATIDSLNLQVTQLQSQINRLTEDNEYLKKIIDTFSAITKKPKP
jgi:transcriptional regulator with XRE-family HTH domain